MYMNRHKYLFILLLVLMPIFLYSQTAESESTIVCPACQAVIPASVHFCPKCGERIVHTPKLISKEETKIDSIAVENISKSHITKGEQSVQTDEPMVVPEDTLKSPIVKKQKQSVEKVESVVDTGISEQDILADSYYKVGMAMFDKGAYTEAAIVFKNILKEAPDSKYADSSAMMIKACQRMVDIEKKDVTETKKTRKKRVDSALKDGFIGGCLSIAAAVLLLIVLASGN